MKDLWLRLRNRHRLDADLRQEVREQFGKKGGLALDAIDAAKVKKYRDFFVVEGRTAAYIVDEDFCSCRDFLYRGRPCWHLLAVRIAQETASYTPVDSWYQDMMENP
jgi:predicted nucleic acid-binding Zn finger protein